MAVPDDPFWREFIDELPARTAKFASVAADGSPRVSPIWVALDGDDVMFTTHSTSAKAKAIGRDARVAMCFDDERPPFSNVILFGTASVVRRARRRAPMGDHHRRSLHGRRARAEAYGARNGVPGEVLVRVTPTKVITARDLAD